ncbi:MAG TPA: carboxymuconolactone decarboxylase family protein [Steroidobacteraceae bacterium]|nr:carboxymuconolactone decarboxylase family protein [Steroidobacteraceae bacterium]
MSPGDPAERIETGVREQTELLGARAAEPATLLESSWRDYVFAEVWTRPGLDRRSRYLISIASAACEGGPAEVLEGYVRGALKLGELSLGELREAALQLAVYAGWSRGLAIDAAVTRVAGQLGLPPAGYAPIRADPWDPEQRIAEGTANFTAVMIFPPPPPVTPYYHGGILNFVFGEMWMRPGLDQRSRRWVTLVGVADSSASTPIRTHTYAAMASGNATVQEMQEFVLQYAIHGGWPKASVMQGAVLEMGDRVSQGLPYQ